MTDHVPLPHKHYHALQNAVTDHQRDTQTHLICVRHQLNILMSTNLNRDAIANLMEPLFQQLLTPPKVPNTILKYRTGTFSTTLTNFP
jgi:hypothetical protein